MADSSQSEESPKSPLSVSNPRSSFDSSIEGIQFRIPDYTPRSTSIDDSATAADPWPTYGTIERGSFDSNVADSETHHAPRFSIYRLTSLPRFSITHFPRFSIFYQRDWRRFDILMAVLGFVLLGSLVAAFLVRMTLAVYGDDEVEAFIEANGPKPI